MKFITGLLLIMLASFIFSGCSITQENDIDFNLSYIENSKDCIENNGVYDNLYSVSVYYESKNHRILCSDIVLATSKQDALKKAINDINKGYNTPLNVLLHVEFNINDQKYTRIVK